MELKDYRYIIRQMERDMQQLSDEVFQGFFDAPISSGRFWHPAVDLYESDTHLLIKIELAGVKADELQVALSPDDRVLSISGTRKEGAEGRHGRLRAHQLEIYFGPFERSIPLPQGIQVDRENVAANYKDGMLLVGIPKKPVQVASTPRIIPIVNDGAAVDQDQGGQDGGEAVPMSEAETASKERVL